MPTRRILVVEDELNVRLTLAQMLRLSGYEVLEAATGDDAIALARGTNLDLVLSDIRLPGIDGYELFRRIRALQPEIRGVAMTGYADGASQRMALEAGFDCLLRKPFPFNVLLQAIASCLGSPPAGNA
ncbi:MAG TPA: response regulator [Armatimonadetes bacterium]|jgi:CheY-like chemotaxis protein|nr:response regulator [Armatimonadota bacterium]